ncbi:hypothetical protein HUA74_26455 [Myxococcus sp. CA051A]|uniref:hypothetical protein n=3 Tax=unclassified Myxococcus TaxID=2648731 RepID=UPI00157A8247|nr:hypothetical protein [Myxococcus sp. CA051A]NTX64204.1 hypothetical protein [Myxococcus sp. CA051A]
MKNRTVPFLSGRVLLALAACAVGAAGATLTLRAPSAVSLSDAAPPVVPEEATVRPSPPAPVDPAEEQRRVLADYAGELHRHDQEPIQPGWAVPTETGLRADLDTLRTRRPFSVLGVDCRTRTCVMTLEWPDYERATETADALLHHRYVVPCARTVLMPEPPRRNQPYRTQVLLDCMRG